MKVLALVFGFFFSLYVSAQAKFIPFVGAGPVSKQSINYKKDFRTFPEIKAVNLEGTKFNLPQDFKGKLNILVIAFQREQQAEVNTWIDGAKPLLNKYSNLSFYEIPTIEPLNFFQRLIINNGMRGGIPNKSQREETITLYLDKPSFKQALGINTEDDIFVALVKPDGTLLWTTSGIVSAKKLNSLESSVKKNI